MILDFWNPTLPSSHSADIAKIENFKNCFFAMNRINTKVLKVFLGISLFRGNENKNRILKMKEIFNGKNLQNTSNIGVF